MRRIRLVLALAAVMVMSLVAASPAYAIGDPNTTPGDEGTLGMRTATQAVSPPPDSDRVAAPGELRVITTELAGGTPWEIGEQPPPDSD